MSIQIYAEVFKTGKKLLEDLWDAFGVSSFQSDCLHESVAINTLPWHRKEIVEISENETGEY